MGWKLCKIHCFHEKSPEFICLSHLSTWKVREKYTGQGQIQVTLSQIADFCMYLTELWNDCGSYGSFPKLYWPWVRRFDEPWIAGLLWTMDFSAISYAPMEILRCFFKLPAQKQRKWTQENNLKETSKFWLQPIKARKSIINGSTKTSSYTVFLVWSEVIATIWNGLMKNESSFNVTHHY